MRRLLLLIVWMVSICFVMRMEASPFVQDDKRRDILLSRSDSLFAAGVDLFQQDKYKEAIHLFEESDRIDKAELDSTSNRRDYSAMWMASCYYHLGDTATAQSIHEYYRFVPVDRRLTVQSDSLSALGVACYERGDYEEALKYFKSCGEIETSIVGNQHIFYGNTLGFITSCYIEMEDSVHAFQTQQQHIQIIENYFGTRSTQYMDALSVYGDLYSAYSSHEQALACYKESYQLADSIGHSEAIQYFAFQIADEYGAIGQQKTGEESREYYNRALDYLCKADTANPEIISLRDIIKGNIAFSFSEEAEMNYNKGNFSEATRLEKEALNVIEKSMGKENTEYIISLNSLTLYSSEIEEISSVIQMGENAINATEKIFGKEHPEYARAMNNLSICYVKSGNYNEALRLGTIAANIRRKVLGEKSSIYAISLHNLAHYNYKLGNYSEAIRLETEALNIERETLGEGHPDYAIYLTALASYNTEVGNLIEAIRLGTKASKIIESTIGKENLDYATSLNNLAGSYFMLGNYIKAIQLNKEALAIKEKICGKQHIGYVITLRNLANYTSCIGKYQEAIQLGIEALNLTKDIVGNMHPEYASSLNSLALDYSLAGNFVEAMRLSEKALYILDKTLGENHPTYAVILGNLAFRYSDIGNNKEALRIGKKALNIIGKTLGKEHPDYANILDNLANYNFLIGNYTEALQQEENALAIIGKVFGKKHDRYAASLNLMANSHYHLGNYMEALRLIAETIVIKKDVLGSGHPNYISTLNDLASYNFTVGNNSIAISIGTDVIHSIKKILGENHPTYFSYLNNLATYYAYSNKKNEATKLYAEVTTLYSDFILSTFADLTPYEQSMFWSKYYNYFNTELPQRAYALANDSLYASAYNGILLSKGLLLNAETEMKKLLQESGDTAVVTLYEQARTNRILLNKTLERPVNERYFNVDSLQRLIKRQEQELIQRSKTYGDFTHNLAINWQEVQKELDATDIAVEFLAFPTGKDSVMYAALALKQGAELPEMVPLFEEEQLKQIVPSNLYSTTDLYKLVWQPMEEKLKGVKNIYFAPSGELYNIAIESLPDTDSTLVSDRFNLYRLSSTRQLALVGENHEGNGARIYGGLKYDTGVSQLVKDNLKYKRDESLVSTRSFEDSFIADSLHLRSGAEELPGTKIEAENIKRSLDRAHVKNELYTDTIGTEASFKAMSGKRIKTLHIATHGFYWTEREAQQLKKLNFLQLDDNNRSPYVEDKALTRSGLLMSGANNALMGIEMPEEIDNGILTAKEIAGLDLRGLDLVVLSACQTGLGEITGDGVFGLQRGFKKAGAQSLLISLWKVDDQATQMLMTQFYANLIKGQSKYEALREAQRYVRDYETEETVIVNEVTPSQKRRMERQGITWEAQKEVRKIHPYAHPKYWAAFILLDAVN